MKKKMMLLSVVSALWLSPVYAQPEGKGPGGRHGPGKAMHAPLTEQEQQWVSGQAEHLPDGLRAFLKQRELDWATLPDERKKRVIHGWKRWQTLDDQEKQRVISRMKKWDGLSDEEKQQRRQRFETFQQLPDEEKARIKSRFHRFKDLPEEERQRLKEKWRAMPPEKKQVFRERIKEKAQSEPGTGEPLSAPGSAE